MNSQLMLLVWLHKEMRGAHNAYRKVRNAQKILLG
jgi:hypothetical protein